MPFYLEDVKFTDNSTPKFDFSAETQNFIEYVYPLNFNFNSDIQKVNAEIPFTPSDLELFVICQSGTESLFRWSQFIHQE